MTKVFADIGIIILPYQHIESSISISLLKNPNLQKSVKVPNFPMSTNLMK